MAWGLPVKGFKFVIPIMPAEIRYSAPSQKISKSFLKQRDSLNDKFAALDAHPYSGTSAARDPHKQVADSLKKRSVQYKFKCPVKSCGKIMTSEPSYHNHMKKHNDKKGKRNDGTGEHPDLPE